MVGNRSESYVQGPVLSRREALLAGAGTVALAALPSQSAAATGSPAKEVSPMTLTMTVNGELHVLTIDPRQSILDVLRETLDLTGT